MGMVSNNQIFRLRMIINDLIQYCYCYYYHYYYHYRYFYCYCYYYNIAIDYILNREIKIHTKITSSVASSRR